MDLFSRKNLKNPAFWICAAGLAAMGALYVFWYLEQPERALSSQISALASALLFTILCLRFVPEWMKFWRFAPGRTSFRRASKAERSQQPRWMDLKIFIGLLLAEALVFLMVFLLRRMLGYRESLVGFLEFWRCLDSKHYLEIAANGYSIKGDAALLLVFQPGYPMLIGLLNRLVGNHLYAAQIISALCFPAAGCIFYRLLRLDHAHADALRTIKYLCILPGLFFFIAPMSESLFLLLIVGCLYCARTKKWLLACLLGGYAAFTRTLGVTLLVPLIMELVHEIRIHPAQKPADKARWIGQALSLLLVLAGLGVYLFINYKLHGDPFKFLEYQREHWSQRFGLFFNTASYQMESAIRTYESNIQSFSGLWLPSLISCFGTLILMICGAKRMRASYIAWFIAYFFIAIGATWLLSAPRYLLVMIAMPMALSSLTRNPDADLVATPLCITASLLYLYAFTARWQVW